jgi:large subunit ribosomal protein L10
MLRDYAKGHQALVLKGGLLGEKVVSATDIEALADLPPRDVLLAQLAGALQAPLVKLAGLLQALPRNFAYGLAALIDQRGGPEPTAPTPEPEAPADGADAADAVDAAADEAPAETPEPEASAEPPSNDSNDGTNDDTDAAEAPVPAESQEEE